MKLYNTHNIVYNSGKRKSKSLDYEYDEATYDIASGIMHTSKSRNLEKADVRFYNSRQLHEKNNYFLDFSTHEDYIDGYQEKKNHYRHHRHQNSLPEADQLTKRECFETDRRDNISERGINDMNLHDIKAFPDLIDLESEELKKMYWQNVLTQSTKNKRNGDKLKKEPMKIKVGEFHPHQNNSNNNINNGSFKHNGKNKNGSSKNGKHKGHKSKETSKAPKGEEISSKNILNCKRFSGGMYVKIFCGHGLKTVRRTILRDLYCVLSVDGDSKARTAAKTGAINFDWDENFEIELSNSHTINFSIYSWDPVARQRLCYTAQLIIEDFISIHGNQRRLAMKLQPSGTLYVELIYRNLGDKFSRVPVPAENAIFGVVIDDLIAREALINTSNGNASGGLSRVPRSVRACVYEIELRGLDSMGIYRLSGSYDSLNKLKKKIECHYNGSARGGRDEEGISWNGNSFEELLSATNVPDVNIVAG